ncbi:MAG: glycine zipper 2TM domain-containing protein [bacterium]|nr:glycine zipper 2TM domain-containing protein [Gammaproteobacteria bacterium]
MSLASRSFKQSVIATAVLILGFTGQTVLAQENKNYYYAYADVVDVEPIISQQRISTPHRECTMEPVRRRVRTQDGHDHYRESRQQRRFLPTLIGGLVGGVIGSQFGGGRGKTAMTVIGAFSGAHIANSSSSRGRSGHKHHDDDQEYYFETAQREHCETNHVVETVERLDGYAVTYRYLDREFTKSTTEHPGDQVRIRVELSPVVDESDAAYASL